jgi:hypothetical protein
VSKSAYKSELLAAQLLAAMRSALRGAIFNGRGWMLHAPSAEVTDMLLTLKLVRNVAGHFQITIAGMNVRATLARKAPTPPS